MAALQDEQDAMIEKGKRWVEAMCGRSHPMTEVRWHDQDETAHLHYGLLLPPRQHREEVHLAFTRHELAECATNFNARVPLLHRIRDALAPWLAPREAQDF